MAVTAVGHLMRSTPRFAHDAGVPMNARHPEVAELLLHRASNITSPSPARARSLERDSHMRCAAPVVQVCVSKCELVVTSGSGPLKGPLCVLTFKRIGVCSRMRPKPLQSSAHTYLGAVTRGHGYLQRHPTRCVGLPLFILFEKNGGRNANETPNWTA